MLQPGGPAPKRLRDESRGLGGGGEHQQGKRRGRQRVARRGGEQGRARQVEYARVQCGSWECSDGGRQLCSGGGADTGGAAGSSKEGDMVGGRSSQGGAIITSWMQRGEG